MCKSYLIFFKHPEKYGQPFIVVASNFEWDNEDKTVSFFDEDDIRVAIFNTESMVGISRIHGEQGERAKNIDMHYFPTEMED